MMGPPAQHDIRLLAALDSVERLGPGLVIDAGLAAAAILDRRLPEVQLLEEVGAVGRAAFVAEDRLAFAGRGYGGHAAGPGRHAGPRFSRKRVLPPQIGA